MKKIKTYKLFENLQKNEDYITLSHLLYDLFDKWGIEEWRGEDLPIFQPGTNLRPWTKFGENPTHKFWVFKDKAGNPIKSSDLDNEDIVCIMIYNVDMNDYKSEFKKELESVIKDAEESIGRRIVYADNLGNSSKIGIIIPDIS